MDTEPRILEAINDIKTEMARIATKVEERNESALVWRGDVCKKFDRQNEKIDNLSDKVGLLPCKERQSIYTSVKGQLAVIWVVIVGIVIALFGEWIRVR
jgi:hypothetical protein